MTTRFNKFQELDARSRLMKYHALVVPMLVVLNVDRVPLVRADLLQPKPTILINISTVLDTEDHPPAASLTRDLKSPVDPLAVLMLLDNVSVSASTRISSTLRKRIKPLLG